MSNERDKQHMQELAAYRFTVDNLRERVAELEAQLAATHPTQQGLEKDAARYQWLRERDLETVHKGGVFAGMTPENYVLNGADLDAAIDAALAAQAKQGEQANG